MRPRIFPDSQQQLASACEALSRRAHTPPERSQPKDWRPLIIGALCVMVAFSLINSGWRWMLEHAMPSPGSYPIVFLDESPVWHNGIFWRVGDRHDITFPARPGSGEKDLRVRVRYIGETKDNRTPGWIQNGDMMKNKGYFWVWTTVPGSNIPRWIDP
jgi:hypothetical protein